MKKYLFLFIFLILPALLKAETNCVIMQNDKDKIYPINKIVQKEPVTYTVSGNPDLYDLSAIYQDWFKNVLRYLQLYPNRKEELKSIADIIDFGASAKAAVKISAEEDPLIQINAVPEYMVRAYCGHEALACFTTRNNQMKIYMPDSNPDGANNWLLRHEAGHSLLLDDLYEGHISPESGFYGSGIKDSIMNSGKDLTCDDADAIVNTVYLALKKNNPQQEDLTFRSFCNASIVFKNGMQLNRKPFYIDFRGGRTAYTYCKDGRVQTAVRITPSDYNKLYTYMQEPIECEAVQGKEYPIYVNEYINYKIVDFETGKTIKQKRNIPTKEFAVYTQLPKSGGITLAVVTDNQNIPAYARITDEKDDILYLFAYLDGNYNLVYDKYENLLFIYDRENISNYFFYRDPEEMRFQCKLPESDCLIMKEVLNTNAHYLAKETNLYKPLFGGSGSKVTSFYIQQAQVWQDFISKNHPPQKMLLKNILDSKATLNTDSANLK